MHGCSLASGLPVNAEVDSMGGVVEVGDSAETGVSQRHAAIEKVQAELRHEYDVREERRRELEYLEKGGNPLDFKVGNAASTSVQSTSLTDQHPELFGTSEAKDSFAFTVSAHGDSVESSGRPRAQSACEPISADNLMLFDGENYPVGGDRIAGRPNGSNVDLKTHSYNLDASQNAKDIGESGAVAARKLYNRRRYRSRSSRDAAKSSSSDAVLARVINGSSLHSFGGSRNFKGLVSDREQEQKVSSNGDSKPTRPVSVAVCRTAPSTTQMDAALDIAKAVKSTIDPIKDECVDSGKDSDIMNGLDSDPQKLGVHKDHKKQSMQEPYALMAPEEVVVEGLGRQASLPLTDVETHVSCGQMKGSSTENLDVKSTNSVRTDNATLDSNILESVSSCTQTRHSLDKNVENGMCTNGRHVDASGDIEELASALGGNESIQVDHETKEKDKIEVNENDELVERGSLHQSLKENSFMLKAAEESNAEVSGMHNEVENQDQNKLNNEDMVEMDVDGCGVSETGRDTDVPFGVNMNSRDENLCKVGSDGSSSLPIVNQPEAEPSVEVSTSVPVVQASSATALKASRDEDSILEQARIIEAKRKRIAQLSFSDTPGDCCPKSHWGFVLEEMAWLANDFAQERLWKISAALQVGRRASLLSLSRFQKPNCGLEGQKVARFLARAVMEFWHSLERKSDGQELQSHSRDYSPALQEYALRFRRSNTSEDRHFEVGTPAATDRDSDVGIIDISLDDCSKEENAVYVVPPGAMARYRNSVESCVVKYEKTGSSLPEEFETSTSDAVADNAYEGDDGETSLYDLSVALDSSKSLKYPRKKLKISTKAYSGRKLEGVADSPFFLDKKVGNQPPVFMGRRPDNSFNVSFPTKRVRTSNRQRVLGSFAAGTSCALGPTKTDASSGDTNSFQDDQSTLDGVPHAVNRLEFESVGDFEKRLGYDSAEVSPQPKKKARFLGSAYEQKWLVESNFLNNQRDHSRKRLKSLQFESNGGSGLFGHHNAKKPKMVRQSIDNAIESSTQFGGSVPSPVASQISNPNKFRKYFGGRDGGRKTKMLKIPASQPGSESPWSLFEEQALVVLVHDLGPNWELVSDAVNSTLQFKSIFRSPKECKERHKLLMDTTSGDGADSAEDSGSSQPYSSTLPGIPKGSARQLFQRLQGPMEEDTLKSHFEKIIMIGQKLHSRRKQEPKQIQPPHGSHMVALAQVYPNNLNGGPILTPLDFCDATACSSDVLPLGYPDLHSSVLPTSNQGMTPMLSASGANSPVLGSSNLTTGNNVSSSPAPVNASLRDGRYALPKSTNMTIEEQRIQQYNQMLSGRNVSQSNLSSPGPLPANDRSLPMLPGSNGVPIASGGNRSLPIARPGFQGIASSSMSNAGSTVTSGMVTMPSPVGCGQGNSSRPRDASHMNLPTQNQDPQRQMIVPELQMQVSQGSNLGIPPYAAMSSAFPNQRASSSYSLHHQQSHTMPPQQLHSISPRHPHIKGNSHLPNPQHQAYAIRLAKERQLQQRVLQRQQQLQQQQLQQQQQPFQSHNAVMPHVHSQAQLPISSPPHNSSQATSQTATSPAMLSPLTQNSHMTAMPQHQQQHPNVPLGLEHNAQSPNSSMTNQAKQRQRQGLQQFAQSGRQHPQQRQQVKVSKGLGRGNMAVHQKIATEPSKLHALSVDSGNHSGENGETPMHLSQGKGLYPSSATNHVSAGKSLVRQSSNQSQPVQRMYAAGQASSISKPLHQKPCNSDGVNQGRVSQVSSGTSSMDQQSVSPLVMAASGQQQLQPQGRTKLVNQSQPSGQKVLRQNLHLNSESTKLQGRSEPQNEQILTVSSQTGTAATMSPASNDASNVSKVISPANDTPWRGSELLYDSGTSSPAPHPGTSGSASSTSTDPLRQVGQGPGEQHSSDDLPSVSHDVSTQRQQQAQVHLPPPPQVFEQLQQQEQSLQQKTLPLSVSQLPTQLKGSMYVRPPESMLE